VSQGKRLGILHRGGLTSSGEELCNAEIKVRIAVLTCYEGGTEDMLGIGEGHEDGTFLLRGQNYFRVVCFQQLIQITRWVKMYRTASFSSMTKMERSSLQDLRS
jgi:hypothetical protein